MANLEQKLLDTIQDSFPLEERPYQVLAEQFGSDEQTVFASVENLRQSGVIRRIGGVYDSRALGFISRLCAGKVPTAATGAVGDSALELFAAAVNAIPAITHNYVRSHEYNVWFTVIAENESEIQKVVDALCSRTDLHDVHVLSVTKKFKIDTVMRVLKENGDSRPRGNDDQGAQSKTALSSSDKARIRIACDDIPHTLTPYADWGVSPDELRDDLAQKRMRRFGAILRHQQAGFAYNAMVCFNAFEGGEILAQNSHVSHCYERPAFDGFPYMLYAMMHAQSAEDLDRYIKEAADSIGNPDYAVLLSIQELKKTSFQFFV